MNLRSATLHVPHSRELGRNLRIIIYNILFSNSNTMLIVTFNPLSANLNIDSIVVPCMYIFWLHYLLDTTHTTAYRYPQTTTSTLRQRLQRSRALLDFHC